MPAVVDVTEMTNWGVDLIGVRKTYPGGIEALRGVNVQVGRGEIFGLLGPNGAGKTTLVKIMMTVVRADQATGTILGRPLGNNRKLARIGYLPESHRFPAYLTASQVLDFFGALAKVPAAVRRKRASQLLDRVGLSAWVDERIGKYSKGMLQRLGLAQALINDPDLLVLDEPTDGVDPMGRRDIRELILECRSQGKTVFINSHMLSELEMVCDRVSILVSGLVARQGRLKELAEQSLEYRITTAADLSDFSDLGDAIGKAGGKVSGKGVTVTGHDTKRVNRIVDLLRQKDILIESVEPRRFSLEEIFVEAMGSGSGVPRQSSQSSQSSQSRRSRKGRK